MPAAVTKATLFGEKLERSNPLTPFEIRRILQEINQVLRSVNSADAAVYYALMAAAQHRLRDFNGAISSLSNALKLNHPDRLKVENNLAAVYLEAGRPLEALDLLASICGNEDATDRQRLYGLANMADALFALGQVEDGYAAFQEALNIADLTNHDYTFMLAAEAAEIGAEVDAYRLWQLHLSQRNEKGEELQRAQELLLSEYYKLGRLVALAEASKRVAEEPALEDESGAKDAVRVFKEFRDLRARATEAILGDRPDVSS